MEKYRLGPVCVVWAAKGKGALYPVWLCMYLYTMPGWDLVYLVQIIRCYF